MKIKSIHFVGIKGVGMTPLAIIAKEAGIEVSGSDIEDKFITDELLKKAKIVPIIGFSKENMKTPDLVITTGAHGGFENVEVKEAKRRKIKIVTQGEAVGLFIDGEILGRKFSGISVTGTHGKTTTTAMIATILKVAKKDPSFTIGTGMIPSLGSSGHLGKGKYFVAEADEYMTEPKYDKKIKFMWQNPEIIVITNIEFDHPDAYKSLADVEIAFGEFAKKVEKNGILVTSYDREETQKLLLGYKGKVFTYGFSGQNNFVVSNIKSEAGSPRAETGKTGFDISHLGQTFALKLNVFGEHNALNATAAFVAAFNIGLKPQEIAKGLLAFRGTKRRSEFIGKLKSGAMIFDDYAHHPTEIKNTLKAFRNNFPNSKIVCIFQPHMYSRTRSLFEQFCGSFNDADTIVLTDIFASLREKKDLSISSRILKEGIRKYKKEVYFIPKLSNVVKYINKMRLNDRTIVITMGAGDVYKISEELRMKN